jgi:hypothetical protein
VLMSTLQEVELTIRRTSQRTEWSGEESLGRSRLEPGCSNNMTMILIYLFFYPFENIARHLIFLDLMSNNTGLSEMIVRILTCHTQYT